MVTAPTRQSATSKRVGYAFAVVVIAAMVYAVNVWPGWRAAPFLTEDFGRVLGLINLSLIAGIVANLVYIVIDRPWVTALGGLVTTSIGLAATLRLLNVFPFDFSDYRFDWGLLVRILLIVGVVGSAIAILVNLVEFGRTVAPRRSRS